MTSFDFVGDVRGWVRKERLIPYPTLPPFSVIIIFEINMILIIY